MAAVTPVSAVIVAIHAPTFLNGTTNPRLTSGLEYFNLMNDSIMNTYAIQ